MEPCSQTQKITDMDASIKKLDKVVFLGNGKDSILVMVTQTRDSAKIAADDIAILKDNVGALIQFQNKSEAADEVKKMIRANRRWVVGMSVAAAISIICALIIVAS